MAKDPMALVKDPMALLKATNCSVMDNIIKNINNYEYIKSVLTIMGPNHAIFKKNMTITHLCIYSNNINVVKIVLDEGGNPNIEDMYGTTPTDLCHIMIKPEYLKLLNSRGGKNNFCWSLGQGQKKIIKNIHHGS